MRIRKPAPRTLALAVGVGAVIVVAVCYGNGWLTRPNTPQDSRGGQGSAADFHTAETRRSVVFIKCLTPGLPPVFGSGFLVSADGLVYTNRHVIQPEQPIQGSIVLVGVPDPHQARELLIGRIGHALAGRAKQQEVAYPQSGKTIVGQVVHAEETPAPTAPTVPS